MQGLPQGAFYDAAGGPRWLHCR